MPALVSINLVACTNPDSRSSKNVVRCWLMTDLTSVDPRVIGTFQPQAILAKLFEGLVRLDSHGTPQPGLAQSISLSQNKRVYTFSLRPSQWSDGSRLTAYDFEYAWKSILSLDVPTKHIAAFFCIKNAKAVLEQRCNIDQLGVRVLDDLTLQVELEYPAPYFLEWLANPLYSPVCKACLPKGATMDTSVAARYICNGPYMIANRILNHRLDLVKNPYYWNAHSIKADEIQFSIIPDVSTGYNLFCMEEIDWFGEPFGTIPPGIAENLVKQNRHTILRTGGIAWIRCNVNLKPLSSKKIRTALACAINREELSTKFLQNLAFPAYSIVTSGSSLLDQTPFTDHDLRTAQKLFAEGLKELGYTVETFPHLSISCRVDQRAISMCELIAQQLQTALGITVHLNILDNCRHLDAVFHNRFELCCSEWISYLSDPIYNLSSFNEIEGGYSTTGWKNQAYTDLLKASNLEEDLYKRTEILKRAEALIMDEMPCIPVVELPFFFVKRSNLDENFFTGIDQINPNRYVSKRPQSCDQTH